MGLFCVLLHPRQLHSQVTPPSDPPTLALSLVQGRRAFWALSSRGKFYTWRFLGEWSRSRCRAGDMKRRMKVISNTFGNVHVYNGQFVAEFLYIRDINKEVGEVERNWKVQTQPVQE